MGLRDIIEKFTGDSEPEELEVSWSEADEIFYSRKSREIEEAEKQASHLIEATDEFLEELHNSLSELEDYRDQDDIQVVEDVVENIHQSKKKLVEGFNPSEDIGQHEEDLEELIQEFNDVSRKEGAVMKRVAKNSGEIASSMEDLIAHQEDIQDFLSSDYTVLKAEKDIEEKIGSIQSLEAKLAELEDNKDLERKIEEVEEKLEMKERQIMDLEVSDKFQELEKQRDQVKDFRKQKREVEKEIKSDIARLERGLKKIIYEIENNGAGFAGNTEKLKKLKDGDYTSIKDPVPDLNEALSVAEENDVLGRKQEERFKDAIDSLSNFEDRRKRIKAIEEEIDEKKSDIESAEIEDRMEALEREKKSLEKELEDENEKLEKYKQRIKETEEQITEHKQELEDTLNEHINAKIEVEF